MYYTLQPLTDPNLTHSGFYFLLVILAVVWAAILYDGEFPSGWVVSLSLGSLAVVSFLSFSELPAPLNQPVTGILISQYSAETSGPKGRKDITNYVTYRVPKGEVSFVRSPGLLFPETALLYEQRNTK